MADRSRHLEGKREDIKCAAPSSWMAEAKLGLPGPFSGALRGATYASPAEVPAPAWGPLESVKAPGPELGAGIAPVPGAGIPPAPVSDQPWALPGSQGDFSHPSLRRPRALEGPGSIPSRPVRE
jgi:hypothetical protein